MERTINELAHYHDNERPTLLLVPVIHNPPLPSTKIPSKLHIHNTDSTETIYHLNQIFTSTKAYINHYCARHLCTCSSKHTFNLHITREGPLPIQLDSTSTYFDDLSPWSILVYTQFQQPCTTTISPNHFKIPPKTPSLPTDIISSCKTTMETDPNPPGYTNLACLN